MKEKIDYRVIMVVIILVILAFFYTTSKNNWPRGDWNYNETTNKKLN